jgi:uncharacterized protein (DUF433 family)
MFESHFSLWSQPELNYNPRGIHTFTNFSSVLSSNSVHWLMGSSTWAKVVVSKNISFYAKIPFMLIVEPHPIPLRKEPDGTWRIGNTRVLLDLVVHAFNVGRTPEEIVQSYDTLRLEDVYAVITYYLSHRSEVDGYIQQQESEAEALWQDIRQQPEYVAFRQRLLTRRANS